jgi:SAM-dependent methyltransferase
MDASLLKSTARPFLRLWSKATRPIVLATFPRQFKQHSELKYWKGRFKAENGALRNSHYEPLFTTVYGLKREDYSGKRVIDIGCGPRGSLEWATTAAERVGLDPLVAKYLKLGAGSHAMKYVEAASESIPFPDGYFDIVTCLNALDHVDDFQRTMAEIKRITRPGGLFLVSVEIDHPPSGTEPITITEQDMDRFRPQFGIESSFKVGTPRDHDLHRAVLTREPAHSPGKPGVYVAKMRRLGI